MWNGSVVGSSVTLDGGLSTTVDGGVSHQAGYLAFFSPDSVFRDLVLFPPGAGFWSEVSVHGVSATVDGDLVVMGGYHGTLMIPGGIQLPGDGDTDFGQRMYVANMPAAQRLPTHAVRASAAAPGPGSYDEVGA